MSALSLLVLEFVLQRTYLGKAIRAVTQNRDAALLSGVDADRISAVAFGIGTAFAGLAGSLLSTLYAFTPDFGRSFLLKAFCIIVLGGMESVTGVAAGALVLALLENGDGGLHDRSRRRSRTPSASRSSSSRSSCFPQGLPGLFRARARAGERVTSKRALEAAGMLGAAGALFFAPSFLERGTLNDVWSLAFAVILASAWNLLGGFAGQVSLGYSAFLGIGAYTTVLLSLQGRVARPHAAARRRSSPRPSRSSSAPDVPAARALLHDRDDRRRRGRARRRVERLVHGRLERPQDARGLLRLHARTTAPMTLLAIALGLRSRCVVSSERLRAALAADQAGHRRRRGARRELHALQARRARPLGRARRPRGRPLRDQLPVHRARLGLRLPPEPHDRPDADRRRRRDGRGTRSRRDPLRLLQIKLLSIPALRDSYLFIYGALLIVVMLFEPKGLLGLVKRLSARRLRRFYADA